MMWCKQIYNKVENLVINDTYAEIYFYDYYGMTCKVLRNNCSPFRLVYLLVLKYILKQNIDHLTQLHDFFSPLRYMHDMGIFEVVYYSNGRSKRYFTKGEHLDKDLVNIHMNKKPSPSEYLHASLSDKMTITWFINDHLTSFHSHNHITAIDVATILMIKEHKVPDVSNDFFVKVIDDDLNEMTFKDNMSIVLVKDG
jgi:hypothetical protein